MQKLASPSNVQSVRDFNRSLVLRCIERQPGISRTEIAQRIGLTDAAVSRITREIIDCGLVAEGEQIVNSLRPGRRHVGLKINPAGGYVLAACLTLSETSLSLLSIAGKPVAQVGLPEVFTSGADDIIDAIAAKATALRRQARVPRRRILGLGVVTGGAVSHSRGVVHISSLSSLTQVPLGPRLEEALGMPVRLETVGNALNIAHMRPHYGSQTGTTSLLIHIAIGLGASWIINGTIHRGEHDERLIGHVPIAGNNAPCVCGARGCLMTAVSGFAVLRDLHGQPPRPSRTAFIDENETASLRHAIIRANEGEAPVAALFHQAGSHLGQELFTICAVLPPDQVTLAGPVPQSAAFSTGFASGMKSSFGRAGRTPPVMAVSQIGYLRATELFALEEFLFDQSLNTKQLVAA